MTSIESIVNDWNRHALLFSATTDLTFAATKVLPSALAKLALACSGVALTILASERTCKTTKWQRAINYCKVADVEIYSVIAFCLSKFLQPPQNTSSDKPDIVFLHGMLGHGNIGRWLLKNLAPYATVHHIDMGTDLLSTVDIEYEKEIIRCAKLVEKTLDRNKKYILIGHSRGGVISNYLATHTNLVTRVYTICSPQRLITKEGDSETTLKKAAFMNALWERVKAATQVRFTQFISTVDPITTEEQLVYKNELNLDHIEIKEYDTFGHAGGVHSEAVLNEIITSLHT